MLAEMLTNHIRIEESVPTWQQAIHLAALPLLQNGFITENYITSMIENVEKLGPYIVIMPGFAMPHSKTEDGVISAGVSLLKLRKSVLFPEDNEVSLLMVLAADGANAHVDMIGDLLDVLTEGDALQRLFHANDEAEILSCLK
jgi:PTS system mannitol-specific IIA component/PTS system ascorbate-specific IIA component